MKECAPQKSTRRVEHTVRMSNDTRAERPKQSGSGFLNPIGDQGNPLGEEDADAGYRPAWGTGDVVPD